MLLCVWSGALERRGKSRGLSTYVGPSSLRTAIIDAPLVVEYGDKLAGRFIPTPILALADFNPNARRRGSRKRAQS